VSTGDTLHDPKAPILVEPPHFPETVVSMAVEPVRTQDRDRMLESLRRLEREDPTLKVVEDHDTGQVLLSGMGELHLEVVRHRLLESFHVDVNVGRPRVSYRQTVRGHARGEGRFERQVAEKLHFAVVVVEVEHAPELVVCEVEYQVPKDRVPLEFRDAIVDSVRFALASGGSIGLPLSQVRARVVDGEYRHGASTPAAFSAAASRALDAAIAAARAVILE